jgi:nicotinate phosphoribosyltransferase
MAGDVVALEDEGLDGEPLLRPVMRGGRRLAAPEPLASARAWAAAELARLPDALRRLEGSPPYPVRISAALATLARGMEPATR